MFLYTHSSLKYYSSIPETRHYIQQLLYLAESGIVNADLNLRQHLQDVFPDVMDLCKSGIMESRSSELEQRHGKTEGDYRNGMDTSNLYMYQKSQFPVTFTGSQLQMNDLITAIDRVIVYSLAMERWTQHPAGLMLLPPRPHSSPCFHSHRNPILHPLLVSDLHTHHSPLQHHKSSFFSKVKVDRVACNTGGIWGNADGEEVVRAFSAGHLGVKDEVYLNYVDCVPWDAYRLEVVNKLEARPEHFVATSFGLFHVYPDGEIECQSFAEWSRDACICRTISQLPFFRNYLLSKTIRNWIRNVRYYKFNRKMSSLLKFGVLFYPPYLLAIRRIKALSDDLLAVSTITVSPSGGYSASQFWNLVDSYQTKLKSDLNRYIRHCHRVISECVTSQQNKLMELEVSLKNQLFVSDLPISVQKEQHVMNEDELKEARRRVNQMDSFVALSRKIILSSLQEFLEYSSCLWVDLVLSEEQNGRDEQVEECVKKASALLIGDLCFSSTGRYC